MGFTQLSNITNGTYNLGQLLFTGKIGAQGQPDGSFEKINNNKYFGSNSARLTAAQNSTTRSAVVSTLDAEFSNVGGVENRLDAIKDYLTGEGRSGKALYREEVGAMIKILKGRDNLSADDVKAKLDAVRAEQEFKQLRKMTVDSTFGLGNIVMTKGSGQFEKVNNHKIKGYKNNIDLTKLGGVEGEEAAWETNETTSDHIEAVLQMHFADKSSKLAEAIQMAKNGEFGSKDLTNRATLSKLIEFMENKAPSDAFATKAADIMAVKNDAEFCEFIGKLDAEIVRTLDSECAKFLSESKNLTLALLSPQGKYAVMRWANADQQDRKVASRLVHEVNRFLENISNEVQDVIESPIGTSGEKLFKDLDPNTSFVDGENVRYKSPMDYFVRVHLYDQLDSTKMKATSELLSGVALDLGKCPILKDCFNPPINLIFKSYAWGTDNGKQLRMGLFLSAVHNAMKNGVSQNTIAGALISRNQELLAEVKSILEVQEATTENSTSQVELTVENMAKKLGFPTLDEYIPKRAKKMGLYRYSMNKEGLALLNPFLQRVESFNNTRLNYVGATDEVKKQAGELRQKAEALLKEAKGLTKKYESKVFTFMPVESLGDKKKRNLVDIDALSLPQAVAGEKLTSAELDAFDNLAVAATASYAKKDAPPEITDFANRAKEFRLACDSYKTAESNQKESAEKMRTEAKALQKDIRKFGEKYEADNITFEGLKLPPANGELLTTEELKVFSEIVENGNKFKEFRDAMNRSMLEDNNRFQLMYNAEVNLAWTERDLLYGDYNKSNVVNDELAAVGKRMMKQATRFYTNASQQNVGSGEFRLLQDALSNEDIQKALNIKTVSAKTSQLMEFAIKTEVGIPNSNKGVKNQRQKQPVISNDNNDKVNKSNVIDLFQI